MLLSPALADEPCEPLLRALYPWVREVTRVESQVFCTAGNLRIVTYDDGCLTAPLDPTRSDSPAIAVVGYTDLGPEAFPRDDGRVVVAIVGSTTTTTPARGRWKSPFQGYTVFPRHLDVSSYDDGTRLALVTTEASDSICTPRGWHTTTRVFDVTDEKRVLLVWEGETAYKRSRGAGLPPVSWTGAADLFDERGHPVLMVSTPPPNGSDRLLNWHDGRFVPR